MLNKEIDTFDAYALSLRQHEWIKKSREAFEHAKKNPFERDLIRNWRFDLENFFNYCESFPWMTEKLCDNMRDCQRKSMEVSHLLKNTHACFEGEIWAYLCFDMWHHLQSVDMLISDISSFLKDKMDKEIATQKKCVAVVRAAKRRPSAN